MMIAWIHRGFYLYSYCTPLLHDESTYFVQQSVGCLTYVYLLC